MALRIRKNGRVLCAAIHREEDGDTYIPDNISEILSGATGGEAVLVTDKEPLHSAHGVWWWAGQRGDEPFQPHPYQAEDRADTAPDAGLVAALEAVTAGVAELSECFEITEMTVSGEVLDKCVKALAQHREGTTPSGGK